MALVIESLIEESTMRSNAPDFEHSKAAVGVPPEPSHDLLFRAPVSVGTFLHQEGESVEAVSSQATNVRIRFFFLFLGNLTGRPLVESNPDVVCSDKCFTLATSVYLQFYLAAFCVLTTICLFVC